MPTETLTSPLSDAVLDETLTKSRLDHPARVEKPAGALPVSINRQHAAVIGLMHGLCLLALVPWLFSWSGLALAVAGHFVFGMLGINVGYHRLLTHRGFKCPKWLEHSLAVLGICNLQDSPARWVAIHRLHHQHSDRHADPHSPHAGFWWGHMGWVVCKNRDHDKPLQFGRYVRDLLRDPFYEKLATPKWWIGVYVAHSLLFFLAGFLLGSYGSGTAAGGLQLGLSWLVWGVYVRTVFVWHGTWAVNSVTHRIGYRNYDTPDDSRNHWLVALLTHGEGWHNNHHANQRSAAHGHKWWELDMAWWVIRGLEAVGLATNVVRPVKAPIAAGDPTMPLSAAAFRQSREQGSETP